MPPRSKALRGLGPGPRPGGFYVIELAVNLGLPWVLYTLLQPGYGEFDALAWSAAPPAAWSLFELAWARKIDALSMLILGGIILSLLAVMLGGSPRMLMVRDNLFSVPIGVAFLVSAFLRKPLAYYVAVAFIGRQPGPLRENFELQGREPHVLRGLRVMSVAWGVVLVGQGALLGWLAWTWPIGRYLLLSPIIGYGAIAILALWTFWYQNRLRARS